MKVARRFEGVRPPRKCVGSPRLALPIVAKITIWA
jgi:hypothetical protein